MKTTATADTIRSKEFFHIPFWLPPETDIFSKRAQRLTQLATEESSDWQHYLQLLASVCNAQHTLLNHYNNEQLNITPKKIANDLPLSTALIIDNRVLIVAMFKELHSLLASQLSQTAKRAWNELLQLDSEKCSQLCVQAFNQQLSLAHQDYLVWVNAILQIIYTHAAKNLTTDIITPLPDIGFCPCCGTDAVGAVIISNGELEGLRYLCCATCSSRWHTVRARCSLCDNSRDLGVHNIDQASKGALSGAEAECCPQCHSYRKRYRLAKQQYADPIADDLASLSLDLLLSEEGWQRAGANPYLLMSKLSKP